MNCKNCDAPLTGNFCVNCGQKADIHRITFKNFLRDFFHAFTHTDKGILLLIKELMTKPGHVAKEYLDGKRKKYFNPLTFLIILSSLYAFLGQKSGYYEALSGINRYSGKGSGIYTEAMGIMDELGKIVSLFLMPVLMSFLSRLFFFQSQRNVAENLVLNAMVLGQVYLGMILLFIPAFVLVPGIPIGINNGVFHLVMLVYITIAYKQFFGNNVFLTALKAILINILFIVLFWVCIYTYVILKHMILG
ncbi:MAG: DUF3667 domain-containing protein [Cyclobacteriaceae bacterium]